MNLAGRSADNKAKPGLNRVLGLREQVFYGIVLIQPTAPMPLYGVVCQQARGHVVTTILIGMVAMLFTAIRYGRMARAYPGAGSAYTYVGRELHPAAGHLTGWAMIFDYVMNPIICVIWCSKAALNFVPEIPYTVWAVFFAALFTLLNVRGIKASARTTQWITAALGVVIILFFGAAIRYLWLAPDLAAGHFLRPFYDPATKFQDSGGYLLVMEDPTALTEFGQEKDPLADLLSREWGTTFHSDVVIDLNSPQRTTAASAYYDSTHPITVNMNNLVSFYPFTRSLGIAESGENLVLTVLVQTNERSWGETDFASISQSGQVGLDDNEVVGPLTWRWRLKTLQPRDVW